MLCKIIVTFKILNHRHTQCRGPREKQPRRRVRSSE